MDINTAESELKNPPKVPARELLLQWGAIISFAFVLFLIID